MLRIVPVRSPDYFIEKDICKEFRLDLSFLVHHSQLELFQCDHNGEQIERLCDEFRVNDSKL